MTHPNRSRYARLVRWLGACALALASIAVCGAGYLGPVSAKLLDATYTTLQTSASGDVVLVDIDRRTASEIGTWPMTRRTFAKVIEILRGAGAKVVALDVALPPKPAGVDEDVLDKALADAGAGVILQPLQSPPGSEAWMGIRVSGVTRTSDRPVNVDHSIDPATIPRLSFLDVYDANIDFAAVKDKRVVIGLGRWDPASLVEAPGRGGITRAEMDVIVAESLLQGRAPVQWGFPGQVMVVVVCTLLFWPGRRDWSVHDLVLPAIGVVWGSFAVAALVFQYARVIVDPLPSLLVAAGVILWSALRELVHRVSTALGVRGAGSVWRVLDELLNEDVPDRPEAMRRPGKT